MSVKPAQLLKSSKQNAELAVVDLKSQLEIENLAGIIFFCSSHYDLATLQTALTHHFDCQIIGCTTSGEISREYLSDSIVALALSKDAFTFHPLPIPSLDKFGLAEAMNLVHTVERKLEHSEHLNAESMFGFLVTDALSLKEESLIARLSQTFDQIEIFGGSAGDNLEFKKTFVFYDGEFHQDSAVLTIIELKDDFKLFKTQHFVPTNKEMITTDVDFEKRIVKEIDGEPAAVAYARINNLDVDNLDTMDFAMYPLMINLSHEWYIRSIAEVYPDNSLQFYCSIDDGLPLVVAEGQNMLNHLKEKTDSIIEEFSEIYFTLGCDCILRRVENINKNITKDFSDTFSRLNFIGFNSYGEQYKGVHFNQTMTGVVVGKKRHE